MDNFTKVAINHAAELDRLRAINAELLEALQIAAGYISHEQIEHAWINAPDEPAIELGNFLRAALTKASI